MKRARGAFFGSVFVGIATMVFAVTHAVSHASHNAATPAFETAAPAGTAKQGDPLRGKAIFERRCTGCHAMEQNREGPALHGVYGRPAASVAYYPYSPALRKAHIIWNDTTLEQWLADPDTLVPGNNMEFHVQKPQERQDLIRFFSEEAAK